MERQALRGTIVRDNAQGMDGLSETKFGHRHHVASLGRILRALGLLQQKTRPSHPNADPAVSVQPGKEISPSFQHEARFGQKGRPYRTWWLHGERPRGPFDQRHSFAYLFATVEPRTGRAFGLVLPTVSTTAMTVFLHHFSATLADDEHAVMVIDGAGSHTSHARWCQITRPCCFCHPTRWSSTP